MSPEVYRAVIDEAHKRGLRVATHLLLPRRRQVACSTRDLDYVAHSIRDADVRRRRH
jgi:hypothetical protein